VIAGCLQITKTIGLADGSTGHRTGQQMRQNIYMTVTIRDSGSSFQQFHRARPPLLTAGIDDVFFHVCSLTKISKGIVIAFEGSEPL
jgi:hypothetical protein